MVIGGLDTPQYNEYQQSGIGYQISGNTYVVSGNIVNFQASGNTFVTSGNCFMQSGNAFIQSGNVYLVSGIVTNVQNSYITSGANLLNYQTSGNTYLVSGIVTNVSNSYLTSGIVSSVQSSYLSSGNVYLVSGAITTANAYVASGNIYVVSGAITTVSNSYLTSGNVNIPYYPTGLTRTYPIGINCVVSGTIASGAVFSGTYTPAFDTYVKSMAFAGYTQTSDIINAYIGSPGTRITENFRLDTTPIGIDMTVPMALSSGVTLNIYYTSLGSKTGDVNMNVELLR